MGNLDIVSRMKLLMEYDSSKTAKENKIIFEQPSPNKVPNQTQLNQIAHCKSTPRDYNYFAPSVSANVDKLCDNLKLTFPGYYTNTEAYQYSQSEVNQQNQQNQPKANIAIEMERQNRIVNTPTPPDPPLEYNGDILSKPGTKLPKKPWGKYDGKVGNYDALYQKYRKDLKAWYEKNKPNAEWYKNHPQYVMGEDGYPTYATLDKRKVPPGFHEDEYPIYQQQKTSLELKRQQNINNFEEYNKIGLQLQQLKNEYYHPEFPFGIKKADYEKWKQAESQLAKDYEDQKQRTSDSEQSRMEREKLIGTTDYLGKGGQFEKNLGIGSEDLDLKWYFDKLSQVRNEYGYVSTQTPEEHEIYEFWEWGPHEWLIAASIAVWFIPVINTAGPFISAATSLAGKAVIAAALDVSDAALYLEEGNMEMAGMSMLFAAVPFIDKIPGVKQISEATIKEITKKIAERKALQTWEMQLIKSIADNKNAIFDGLEGLARKGWNAIPQSMKPAANVMVKTGIALIKPPLALAKTGLKAAPVLAGYGGVALGYMGAYDKVFREGTPQQIAQSLGYDWNLIKTEFKSDGSAEDNLLLKKALGLGWKPGLPIPVDCWTEDYKKSLSDAEAKKKKAEEYWKQEREKIEQGDKETMKKYEPAVDTYIEENPEEVNQMAQDEVNRKLSPEAIEIRTDEIMDSIINSNPEYQKLFDKGPKRSSVKF